MGEFKYLVLANSLRSDILSGKYRKRQKLPSENELCKKLGLSRQTVRQAIETLDAEGILERRQGSGTYVIFEEPQKKQPTKNIGIISTYTDAYIFPAIINGISEVLQENEYMMQLSLTHNQVEHEARALKMLLEQNVDGFIVEPTKSGLPNPNIALYEQIKSQCIPLVFFNAYYSHLDFQYVCMDDRIAGYKAAKCLIDAGHKAIAGMFKSDDRQGHMRYMGFMDALNEAGMETNSAGIIWFTTEDIPYLEEDIARVKRILKGRTGLVCYNDQIAFPIVTALIKEGYAVPQNISVASIDNAEIATFCEVPLTSVAHPMAELGRCAARSILKLIENPEEQVTVNFEPELIVRESVKNIIE